MTVSRVSLLVLSFEPTAELLGLLRHMRSTVIQATPQPFLALFKACQATDALDSGKLSLKDAAQVFRRFACNLGESDLRALQHRFRSGGSDGGIKYADLITALFPASSSSEPEAPTLSAASAASASGSLASVQPVAAVHHARISSMPAGFEPSAAADSDSNGNGSTLSVGAPQQWTLLSVMLTPPKLSAHPSSNASTSGGSGSCSGQFSPTSSPPGSPANRTASLSINPELKAHALLTVPVSPTDLNFRPPSSSGSSSGGGGGVAGSSGAAHHGRHMRSSSRGSPVSLQHLPVPNSNSLDSPSSVSSAVSMSSSLSPPERDRRDSALTQLHASPGSSALSMSMIGSASTRSSISSSASSRSNSPTSAALTPSSAALAALQGPSPLLDVHSAPLQLQLQPPARSPVGNLRALRPLAGLARPLKDLPEPPSVFDTLAHIDLADRKRNPKQLPAQLPAVASRALPSLAAAAAVPPLPSPIAGNHSLLPLSHPASASSN